MNPGYKQQTGQPKTGRPVCCLLCRNATLLLACAWLCHVAGTQWGGKEYMDMKHLEAMEAGELQESPVPVGSDPAAQ